MNVKWKDFRLVNKWTPDVKGPCYQCRGNNKGEPQFLIDESTRRRYLNESRGVVAFKCSLLVVGTPIVHPVAGLYNIAWRIFKLVTLSHFWWPGGEHYNFKGRALNASQDMMRILATPLAVVGLQLAAIYGLFRPYDGRKLYASLERATYGNWILAPCFQPTPSSHLFGGDLKRKDAF